MIEIQVIVYYTVLLSSCNENGYKCFGKSFASKDHWQFLNNLDFIWES